MILNVEPGKYSLKGSIGTSPAMIIEGLVSIMVVLINPFCIVLDIFIFLLCFDKHMGIIYLLRD